MEIEPHRRPRPCPGPPLVGWGRAIRYQGEVALGLCLFMVLIWALSGVGNFWPRWVFMGLAIPLALQTAVRWGIRSVTGARRRALRIHAAVAAVLGGLQVVIWLFAGAGGYFWPAWPILGLALPLAIHARLTPRAKPAREAALEQRVDVLTRSRSGALDVQAAELRRIERDLHDGAQARIVSLGMSLGLAEQLLRKDPDAAADLLAEARASTGAALDDMRTVMRGIQPPVLADRGLVGAIEALCLDLAVPVTVRADLSGRAPAPVESAMYFSVAECLANVVKHSGATRAWVVLVHRLGMLAAVVGDDGAGGASMELGTGLAGVARRLEVFDGTIDVESPPGGPTSITLELPCELSSPKTSPSFGTV